MILSDETLSLLANLGDLSAHDALLCRAAGSYAVSRNGEIWVRFHM